MDVEKGMWMCIVVPYSRVGGDKKEGERKQGAEKHEDGQKEKEGW